MRCMCVRLCAAETRKRDANSLRNVFLLFKKTQEVFGVSATAKRELFSGPETAKRENYFPVPLTLMFFIGCFGSSLVTDRDCDTGPVVSGLNVTVTG